MIQVSLARLGVGFADICKLKEADEVGLLLFALERAGLNLNFEKGTVLLGGAGIGRKRAIQYPKKVEKSS